MRSPRLSDWTPSQWARTVRAAFVLLAAGFLPANAAELWMPSIFGDGMVLQRDQPLPVWGRARPGEEVVVKFGENEVRTTTDASGRWSVLLPAQSASAVGQDLAIRSTEGEKNLRDVRVGDVWLLGGQSNMGWSLTQSKGGDEAAAAEVPLVFAFQQHPNAGAASEPAEDVRDGRWLQVTPGTAAHQSGVGFFFARALRERLGPDIPIALIHTAMGGTAIEAWIDSASLEESFAGRVGAQFFRDAHKKWLVRKAAWDADLAKWESALNAARAAGEPVPEKPPTLAKEPEGVRAHQLPGVLFNGKISPLQPFALCGILWYQGESNASDRSAAGRYEELLRLLITRWRAAWGNVPFLIVQLPGYAKATEADWPGVRAAQAAVAESTPNCALVVTIDLGERDEIHPRDKRPVGERAALAALHHVYGRGDVLAGGPKVREVQRDGTDLRVRFTGNLTTSDGTPPRGFAWIASDGSTLPLLNARIEGAEIVAPSPTPETFTLSHAWANWPEANLTGPSGLPVAPFQVSVRE